MFDVRPGNRCNLLPPRIRWDIQIGRAYEIAHAAAFVNFFDACPEAVEFGAQSFRLIKQNRSMREQFKDSAVGAGDGRVELPSGENGYSARADGRFDDFLIARDALARKACMNSTEQLVADRSFGQR